MGKAIMGAVVSLDGFIADDGDDVRPLFDWYGNGDVTWSFPGTDDEFRTTQASADFMQSHYRDVAAVVIGRRLFDLTSGQALKLGLIDQVVVNQVPEAFGSGRPFFATGRLAEPLLMENPSTIVRGDRVTHLVYDISR